MVFSFPSCSSCEGAPLHRQEKGAKPPACCSSAWRSEKLQCADSDLLSAIVPQQDSPCQCFFWTLSTATGLPASPVDPLRLFDLQAAGPIIALKRSSEENAMAFLRLWADRLSPSGAIRRRAARQAGAPLGVGCRRPPRPARLAAALFADLPHGLAAADPSFIPIFSTENYYRTLVFIVGRSCSWPTGS